MKRRILTLFAVPILCMGIVIPAYAGGGTEEEQEHYQQEWIRIDDTDDGDNGNYVDVPLEQSDSGEGWSYDGDLNLELDEFKGSTIFYHTVYTSGNDASECRALTIQLIGENTVIDSSESYYDGDLSAEQSSRVIITGDGALTVESIDVGYLEQQSGEVSTDTLECRKGVHIQEGATLNFPEAKTSTLGGSVNGKYVIVDGGTVNMEYTGTMEYYWGENQHCTLINDGVLNIVSKKTEGVPNDALRANASLLSEADYAVTGSADGVTYSDDIGLYDFQGEEVSTEYGYARLNSDPETELGYVKIVGTKKADFFTYEIVGTDTIRVTDIFGASADAKIAPWPGELDYDGTPQNTGWVTYEDGWYGPLATVTYENNINAGMSTATLSIARCLVSAEKEILPGVLYASPTVTPDPIILEKGQKLPAFPVVTVEQDNETVATTCMGWYTDWEAKEEITDFSEYEVGYHSVCVGYKSADSNYTDALQIAYVDVRVVEPGSDLRETQDIEWHDSRPNPYTTVYGFESQTVRTASNPHVDGGAITYTSSDPSVVTVDANGDVSGLQVGTATITASAAETEKYQPASISYSIEVLPRPIVVGVNDADVVYGDEMPAFTLDTEHTALANGDTVAQLQPEYICEQTSSANVGTYPNAITATVTADNYEITVINAATLTVTAKELTWSNGVVEKVYDGTNTVDGSDIKTTPVINGVVNGDDVVASEGTVTFTSQAVGSTEVTVENYKVTGTKLGNYTVPTTQPTFSASITPADYQVMVPAALDVRVGSNATAITDAITANVTGVNGEVPTGTITYTIKGNPLVDADVNALAVGDKIIVDWAFTLGGDVINSNYVATAKTGSFQVSIVDGEPQYLTFAETAKTVTYGDAGFTNAITIVTTTDGATVSGGGVITYASDNTAVATVDATTGAISIVGAGTANITATASAVTGVWAQGTSSYVVTVDRKLPVASDFVITIPEDTTFTGDAVSASVTGIAGMGDVTVRYNGTASAPSNVGDYTVTFDVAAGANYSAITGMSAGTFSITKATQPTLADMSEEVYYEVAQKDVAIDLSQVVGLPSDAGNVTYTISSTEDPDQIIATSKIDGNVLTFTTNAMTSEGQSADIIINVATDNYEDATFVVTVDAVVKKVASIVVGTAGSADAITTFDEEEAKTIFTKEETEGTEDLKLELTVNKMETLTADEQTIIENMIAKLENDYAVAMILDIDLTKYVGNIATALTDLNGKDLTITVDVPADMQSKDLVIIRIHEGAADILKDIDSNPATFTFKTDKFSTYVLAEVIPVKEPEVKPEVEPEVKPELETDGDVDAGDNVPETGDANTGVVVAVFMLVSFVAMVEIYKKRFVK